ncbi:sure-like protein [Tilletiopsis washingtonensis]|uniref:Sure-like protein n=1 Tax=Tilletiopsis washingtonensis TaxID=58919 RepID=A0A316ZFA2_9BASI|nr:sure-like protein [Tilletiopsis washingtonensis]PWN99916.1 sure-like protein [Tilletiopsis washingtonensis]
MARPRILLVNDDGPPSPSSPHILGLYTRLRAAGYPVRVVVPSSQKSWGGMAGSLAPIGVWYYYPRADDTRGEHSQSSWSAERRAVAEGEEGEWLAVDASPTAATNIGLFNARRFFPSDSAAASADSAELDIDLVLSGPNFGRNTGTAFALASGTVGAALAAALAGVRSIALSYGHFSSLPPALAAASSAAEPASLAADASSQVQALALDATVRLVERLWTEWEAGVGTYAVNVPLGWTLRSPEIVWTRMWQSQYGQLYRPLRRPDAATQPQESASDLPPAKVDHPYLPATAPPPAQHLHFAPVMPRLLAPALEDCPEGTDVWALMNGMVSITRLAPAFSEPLLRTDGGAPAAEQERPGSAGFTPQTWRL